MTTHITMMRTGLLAAMLCFLMGTSAGETSAAGEQGSAAAAKTAEQTEEAQKAAWQQRMQDARKQLADAEARKAQLQKKSDMLTYEWKSPSGQTTNEQMNAELGRTNAELQRAQRDIDAAKNLIENVIPEEARKAGVPPGWLRE